MKIKHLIVFFIVFMLTDYLIKVFAPSIAPFYRRFAYLDNTLPKAVQSYGNFDGVHYVNIARIGYTNLDFVFLPLYPILIYLMTAITHNFLLSGVLISIICYFIGLVFFLKLAVLLSVDKKNYYWLAIFMLAFPASFFFTSVYTEGLFFLLAVCYFYFLFKKNFLLAALFGFLAPLTKLIGVFLIVPSIIYVYLSKLKFNLKQLLTYIAPAIGLLTYSLYLFASQKDPLSFINLHASFGANRSNHIILLPQIYFRYFKIFFLAKFNFQYFVALIEFSFFNFVLFILVCDLIKTLKLKNSQKTMRLTLNLFSFIVVIIPTLTGTFLSVPRFIVIAISMYLYLAGLKNNLAKVVVTFIFIVFHIIMLVFFTQGYFVS